jgi:HEPN domain-containing protein
LKAVLALRGVEFPFTHDHDGLLELCQGNDIKVPKELSDVDHLSPYGVQLRYGAIRLSVLDRDQALRWAASAIGWAGRVIEPIGSELRPSVSSCWGGALRRSGVWPLRYLA